MSVEKSQQKQSKLPMIISLGILLLTIGCYFILPNFKAFIDNAYDVLTSDNKTRVSDWVGQFGFWGPFLIIVLMLVQMFLFVIPSALIMIVCILAYGPYWGSLLAVGGVGIAASVGYALGAYLGPYIVNKIIGVKTKEKIEGFVNDYGIWAIIIARISPILSNDATSFVAGVLRMGYRKFIVATIAGIIPLTLALAYLGGDFQRLKTGLIWISVISLFILIVYIIYDRSYNRNQNRI
tara:strand:- start:2666 stop:3376 length:711 start_codon:yes stop_codon:yes gene_type:complete